MIELFTSEAGSRLHCTRCKTDEHLPDHISVDLAVISAFKASHPEEFHRPPEPPEFERNRR